MVRQQVAQPVWGVRALARSLPDSSLLKLYLSKSEKSTLVV